MFIQVALIAALVAISEARVIGRIDKRQVVASALPTDVRSLSVLAAQKRIYAGQVQIQNARNYATQVAADAAAAAAANTNLIAQQTATYQSVLAVEAGISGTDFSKFNTAFLAGQKTALVNANNAVAAQILAAETALNATLNLLVVAANADIFTVDAAWIAAESRGINVVCNGVTCANVLNSGLAFCDANNLCAYRCDNGQTAVSAGNGLVSCLNTFSDANNCGAGGVVCQQPYNGIGSTICASGNCAVQCPAGYRLGYFPTGQQYCTK